LLEIMEFLPGMAWKKLVHVRNGAVALSAFANGDAQFYLGAATGSTLGAIAGGMDAVFVTSLIHKLEGTFVVNPVIKAPAELKGKTAGVTSLGGESGCVPCRLSSIGAWTRRRTR
jgi:ABC-type nitrate/sulfonate/bicarbonate transport system substrate-binding protein